MDNNQTTDASKGKKRGLDSGFSNHDRYSAHFAKCRKVNPTVLSPKIKYKLKQRMYETNASTSPLLKLPPELRNRIWSLVLGGGKTVHVFPHYNTQGGILDVERKLCRSICMRVPDDDDETDSKSIKNEPVASLRPRYADRHQQCCLRDVQNPPSASTTMQLQLLQVCRQIHEEAALIPYQENAFSFNFIIDFEAFIEFLCPAQVAAVQHITYVCRSFFHSNEDFEERLRLKLTDLKSLLLFVECAWWERPSTWDETAEALTHFKRLPVKTATTVAYEYDPNPSPSHGPPNLKPKAQLLEWGNSLEQKLLVEWIEEPKPVKTKKKAVPKKKASPMKSEASTRKSARIENK